MTKKTPEISLEKTANLQNEQDKLTKFREHNRMLCYFAIAKIHQRNREHLLALEYFTKSLDVLPMDQDRAFIYFRRAWSYKVRI